MMTTHTRDVPTTQHTTAMMTMPAVAHPSSFDPFPLPVSAPPITPESQLGFGRTLKRICPLSVPSALDISQVYFPASASAASTIMRSWLAAAKKWRSVTTSGLSSLVQFSRGGGLPPAMHWRTAVSPFATVQSKRDRKKRGVSKRTTAARIV